MLKFRKCSKWFNKLKVQLYLWFLYIKLLFAQVVEQRNVPCPGILLPPKTVEMLKKLNISFSGDVGLSDDHFPRNEKFVDLCSTYAPQIAEIILVRCFWLK